MSELKVVGELVGRSVIYRAAESTEDSFPAVALALPPLLLHLGECKAKGVSYPTGRGSRERLLYLLADRRKLFMWMQERQT